MLSTERISSFSARELINFNVYQEFEDNPQKALADLHSALAPTGDEERLFALAELSFLHAENSGERSYYLASAVYAYAFLYPGKQGTPPRGIDPRLRWAVDLYNQSLTQAAKSDEAAYAIPMGGKFKLPFGELTVAFNERDLIWGGFRMKDFVPAADIEVRGLRNRYRTPGIGAALAASLEPLEASRQTVHAYSTPAEDSGHGVFATGRSTRGIGFGKVARRTLEFYTPDSARTLKIEGVEVPIEYETTSALALTLEGAPVWDSEIAGFRSGDFAIGDAEFARRTVHAPPAQDRPYPGRARARHGLEPGALGRAHQ